MLKTKIIAVAVLFALCTTLMTSCYMVDINDLAQGNGEQKGEDREENVTPYCKTPHTRDKTVELIWTIMMNNRGFC